MHSHRPYVISLALLLLATCLVLLFRASLWPMPAHPTPASQTQEWSHDVTLDGATYFTTINNKVVIGNTCDNQNGSAGKTAMRTFDNSTGKETDTLPISTKPYPFFCHATAWGGIMYAPLAGEGLSMSGIAAYSGTHLLWQWKLPSQ